jgi:predicted HAD superfamily Cof-like phosphohydrolase
MRHLSREDVVAEFHKAFNHPVDAEMTANLLQLRHELIFEEYKELREEMAAALADLNSYGYVRAKTKERMLKEMADLQYVLSGLAATFDLPLNVAFIRVHKSNMSKLGEDGNPILREDGKILKGPNYVPADLEDLVRDDDLFVPGFEYYGAPV